MISILITAVLIICAVIVMIALKKVSFLAPFNKSFFRFVIVGGTNTLTYFLFFTILNYFVYYLFAHIAAFLLSATISYFLTTVYTFENRINLKTFIKFPLTYLPNLIMSTFGSWLLVHYDILNENIASLVMMIVAIPITYAVGRILYYDKGKEVL